MRGKILFLLADNLPKLGRVCFPGIHRHADVVLESEEAYALGQPFFRPGGFHKMDARGHIVLPAGPDDVPKNLREIRAKSYHDPESESTRRKGGDGLRTAG